MSEYLDLNLHEDLIQSKDSNILSSEIELFLQEVELAIKMDQTDVYGHYNLFNLHNYVFSQFVTEGEVVQQLTRHIQNNCWHSQYFDWNVEVEFKTLQQRNSALIIKLIINTDVGSKPSQSFMKIFKIEF